MLTHVPERLISIADQMKGGGSVALTKLTFLKKWFARPSRLSSFAIFVAEQACRREDKTTRDAAIFFLETRQLLSEEDVHAPDIPRVEAEKLHRRLKEI